MTLRLFDIDQWYLLFMVGNGVVVAVLLLLVLLGGEEAKKGGTDPADQVEDEGAGLGDAL